MNSNISHYLKHSTSGYANMSVPSHVNSCSAKLIATLALLAATMLGTAQAADEMVFFHVNAVGSATAAFNEAGNLCWKQHYTPYGEQTSNVDADPIPGCGLIGKDRGFTGHTQDESGLTYMQQRYYDASIGRFLSVDPKGVEVHDPRSYNRYSYAANNPYKYVDPDGQAFFLPAIPLIKAAAVFIAKEAAVEAASKATGGATDLLSTRRAAKRGFIGARKYLDPNNIVTKNRIQRPAVRTKPIDSIEKLAMDEAKSGRGSEIMKGKINDPRFKDTHKKMEHSHPDDFEGTTTEIHYWRSRLFNHDSGHKFKDETDNLKSRFNTSFKNE